MVFAFGQLCTAYAAAIRCRSRTHFTWSARHGLGTNDGPLVRPRITNFAEGSGIGSPSVRFCGMPIPFGHCGQLTSPPYTRPFALGGSDRFGIVMSGTGTEEGSLGR